MASPEGSLPVGQPGLTSGNSWTGMQATTPGLRPVYGIHKMVKISHGQIEEKLQRKLQLLLINVIQIKLIPGYNFTFLSSRPVYIEVTIIILL